MATLSFTNVKAQAREIFLHALKEATVSAAFQRHVETSRGVLRVGEDLYQLGDYSRIFAVSFGKAGHSMAKELRAQVGTQLSGIVSAPISTESQVEGFRYFAGGHPQPNQESLRAAEATLKALSAGVNEKVRVLEEGVTSFF